jgi:hypothetical protein
VESVHRSNESSPKLEPSYVAENGLTIPEAGPVIKTLAQKRAMMKRKDATVNNVQAWNSKTDSLESADEDEATVQQDDEDDDELDNEYS